MFRGSYPDRASLEIQKWLLFLNPVMRLLLPAAGMTTANLGMSESPSLRVVLQIHQNFFFVSWNLSRDDAGADADGDGGTEQHGDCQMVV